MNANDTAITDKSALSVWTGAQPSGNYDADYDQHMFFQKPKCLPNNPGSGLTTQERAMATALAIPISDLALNRPG